MHKIYDDDDDDHFDDDHGDYDVFCSSQRTSITIGTNQGGQLSYFDNYDIYDDDNDDEDDNNDGDEDAMCIQV